MSNNQRKTNIVRNKPNSRIKTKGATDVVGVSKNIGDDLADKYWEKKELNLAHATMKAYNTSLNIAKAQAAYNKQAGRTGRRARIPFFES